MTPYPLAWPTTIPRWAGGRQAGKFKATLATAMTNVRDSLRLFGTDSGKPVTEVVIISNVTLGVSKPADPGVAIWFKWDGLGICIPVDRYASVEANLQAIHHVIEARRVEMRHGTLALVRASFAGFMALPSPGRLWWQVLGFPNGTAVSQKGLDAAYRARVKVVHPDAGGSRAEWDELERAMREAASHVDG